MVDFTSILSKPATAVEKPKPKPAGTYQAAITGMPTQKEVNVKGEAKPVISFPIKLVAAREDVDTDQLANHDEISAWPPMSYDVWVEGEQGEWALKRFLSEGLGIDGDDKTLGEMCAGSPGQQLLVTVVNEPFTNKAGEPDIATRIKGYAAL